MKITGLEYKKRLEMVDIEVTHLVKTKCYFSSPLTQRIWKKRKCFICGGKFEDGSNQVVALTKKGLNKIICEKCFIDSEMEYGEQLRKEKNVTISNNDNVQKEEEKKTEK